MEILQLHVLNKTQKSDVETLVNKCIKKDELERTMYLENDMNFYENLDSFYLLYDKKKLLSVLTILAPNETEAEITAYTLPSERKKGYFNTLLDLALDELAGYEIQRVLFVVEPKSQSGLLTLEAIGTEYLKSEFLLSKDLTEFTLLPHVIFSDNNTHNTENNTDSSTDNKSDNGKDNNKDNLVNIETHNIIDNQNPDKNENKNLRNSKMRIQLLDNKGKKEACLLGQQIFANDYLDISEPPDDGTLDSFGAYLGEKLLGVCNVSYSMNYAIIFGFGIRIDFRGNGYSRILLEEVMAHVKEKEIYTLKLAVGSENQVAYSLYKSMGFRVQTQYDYYEYIIEWES
jgi:predicted acetyltransferase